MLLYSPKMLLYANTRRCFIFIYIVTEPTIWIIINPIQRLLDLLRDPGRLFIISFRISRIVHIQMTPLVQYVGCQKGKELKSRSTSKLMKKHLTLERRLYICWLYLGNHCLVSLYTASNVHTMGRNLMKPVVQHSCKDITNPFWCCSKNNYFI